MRLQPGQEAFQFKRVSWVFGLGYQKIVGIGEFRGLGVHGQADLSFGMGAADDPGDCSPSATMRHIGEIA